MNKLKCCKKRNMLVMFYHASISIASSAILVPLCIWHYRKKLTVAVVSVSGTSRRSSQDCDMCMAEKVSRSCAASRPATSTHSSCRSWLTRGVRRGPAPGEPCGKMGNVTTRYVWSNYLSDGQSGEMSAPSRIKMNMICSKGPPNSLLQSLKLFCLVDRLYQVHSWTRE